MPFPQRTVDAIAGCTRTLSGAPHADAGLDRADAATISGFRAFADRLALRERHHDPAVHHRHAPADPAAADIYDALEDARLDALGVRWLRGVRRNLLAHPGSASDGPRWLAFEMFSGQSAPSVKAPLVSQARTALTPPLLNELAELSSSIGDRAAFAARASAWASRASTRLAGLTDSDAARPPILPTRYVERHQRRQRPRQETTAPRPREKDEPEEASAGGPGAARHPGRGTDTGTPDGYRAYTDAFDRVINAAALATQEDFARLHAALESDLGSLRAVVARLAKRLLRVLMAQQMREWRFDLDEGLLDGSRLSTFVASGGRTRPFKEESESPFPDTVITLLIDHSGSMRGRPMQIAALTVEIFARVLERCGVRCEVLGFTTRDWNGGEPAKKWETDGYPENPGRLNALEHIVIKDARTPWRRARRGLGLVLRDELLKENIDGEAVAWAHARLLARPEPRRMLVVVSDGTPMDEATFAGNGFDYLDDHLVHVVQDIESRSPVQLAAIGIGHDVSRFYRNATRIARIDDLGPALTTKLLSLLGAEGAAGSSRLPRRRPLSRR